MLLLVILAYLAGFKQVYMLSPWALYVNGIANVTVLAGVPRVGARPRGGSSGGAGSQGPLGR